MRLIADLHIHSRFARACSRDLTVENLALWADKKGIQVLATGDFTHPAWFEELGRELEETRPGLYSSKNRKRKTLFLYGTELSSIYKQGEKVRRVHNLVFAPNRETAGKINQALEARGCNLTADGRPIIGIKCAELVSIVKDIDENCHVVPAHVWTPHFGVFGSLSGFDSLEQAFGTQTDQIFAIETGLSSDPAMNRQVSGLDGVTLVSNSDAHSLRRLGREANVFDIATDTLSYQEIFRIIRECSTMEFLSTIEYFPEAGRYHLDGHRDCKFSCFPVENSTLGGKCPVCGKTLLKGVLNRVEALADQDLDHAYVSVPYHTMLPLDEVIAVGLGVGVGSKKVHRIYEKITSIYPEMIFLLDVTSKNIIDIVGVEVADAVMLMRHGELEISPGYDGIYGRVHLPTHAKNNPQPLLF